MSDKIDRMKEGVRAWYLEELARLAQHYAETPDPTRIALSPLVRLSCNTSELLLKCLVGSTPASSAIPLLRPQISDPQDRELAKKEGLIWVAR